MCKQALMFEMTVYLRQEWYSTCIYEFMMTIIYIGRVYIKVESHPTCQLENSNFLWGINPSRLQFLNLPPFSTVKVAVPEYITGFL